MSDIRYYVRLWHDDYEYELFIGPKEAGISTNDIEGFLSKKEAEKYMQGLNIELSDSDFIVERGRYHTGDKLTLIALYWNEEGKHFIKKEIQGILDSSEYVRFEERTFDHFGVSYDFINRVVGPGCQCGGAFDYNAVFCWPNDVKEGMMAVARFYQDKYLAVYKESKRLNKNFKSILRQL